MSLRLGALQDALLSGGTDPDLARKVAEELADYERQLAAVRSDVAVVKWMVGLSLALALGNLWISLSILSRLTVGIP
jgi:hypothetical protein